MKPAGGGAGSAAAPEQATGLLRRLSFAPALRRALGAAVLLFGVARLVVSGLHEHAVAGVHALNYVPLG